MTSDKLLQKIDDDLAHGTDEPKRLEQALVSLKKDYEKQAKQLDRLTKLSDRTQAKLTESNNTLNKLLRNLRRYVPAAVVDILMRDGAEQLPTNSRETITVFFSDIVGFTSLTERLEPERLAPLMTSYFTEMTDICTKWGGTLDQFIGDAIVIFFGAPQSKGSEEDAKNAVLMALDMQERLHTLRLKWAQEGLTSKVEVRMGIATGFCNVGNFGSAERLHYTAIGTAVNSAARIQSVCQPNEVLLAHDTYLLVRDHMKCTQDQIITLHGQKHPTTLYRACPDYEEAQSATITADEPGYRFYFDSQEITDTKKVTALLQLALDKLSTKTSSSNE